MRLSGPREKGPRKKKKKTKEEEEETGGKRGIQHHLLPFTSAILSPHPPVCRQSSSSLGLPLRGYHRGYSSATSVRSWFHSRCSNPFCMSVKDTLRQDTRFPRAILFSRRPLIPTIRSIRILRTLRATISRDTLAPSSPLPIESNRNSHRCLVIIILIYNLTKVSFFIVYGKCIVDEKSIGGIIILSSVSFIVLLRPR